MTDLDRTAPHLARTTYTALTDVFQDVVQVSRDLRRTAAQQLLVSSEDLDFLTRRLEFLASGAVEHMQRLQVIPHALHWPEDQPSSDEGASTTTDTPDTETGVLAKCVPLAAVHQLPTRRDCS